MPVSDNIQFLVNGVAVSDENPMPIDDAALLASLGDTDDAAVVNPASNGSLVALLKGVLTELVALNTALGATADAAVSTPATNGTAIALLKGLIVLNQPAG